MIDIVVSLKEDAEMCPTHRQSLLNAAAEITRLRATIDQLRSVAGAVSIESGLTFADLKKQTKIVNNG